MGLIQPFDALIPKETPPEKRIWENPDPRIQWALDILEPPGKYGQPPERIFNRFAYPVGGGALGAMVIGKTLDFYDPGIPGSTVLQNTTVVDFAI